MDDLSKKYPPNTHKYKEAKKAEDAKKVSTEKRVQKVIKGSARIKPKSEISKLKDAFVSEDAGTIMNYVKTDIVIPTTKKTIETIITEIVKRLFWGSYGSGGNDRRSDIPYVSYNKQYRRSESRSDDRFADSGRGMISYGDVILASRADAESVLNHMDDILDSYGQVKVSDVNELIGVAGKFTDCKYGWTNLSDARVVSVRDGYMLKLPRPRPLER